MLILNIGKETFYPKSVPFIFWLHNEQLKCISCYFWAIHVLDSLKSAKRTRDIAAPKSFEFKLRTLYIFSFSYQVSYHQFTEIVIKKYYPSVGCHRKFKKKWTKKKKRSQDCIRVESRTSSFQIVEIDHLQWPLQSPDEVFCSRTGKKTSFAIPCSPWERRCLNSGPGSTRARPVVCLINVADFSRASLLTYGVRQYFLHKLRMVAKVSFLRTQNSVMVHFKEQLSPFKVTFQELCPLGFWNLSRQSSKTCQTLKCPKLSIFR